MSEWAVVPAEDVMRGDTVRLPGRLETAAQVLFIALGHMRSGGAAYWNDTPWEHIEIRLSGREGLPALEFEPAFEFEVLTDKEFERRRVAAVLHEFPSATRVITIVRKW